MFNAIETILLLQNLSLSSELNNTALHGLIYKTYLALIQAQQNIDSL